MAILVHNAGVPPPAFRYGARGRTRPGRLRLLDAHLRAHEPALLCRQDGEFAGAPVVDLGLGDRPATTLELLALLRSAGSTAPLIAVDHEPERVTTARALAEGRIDARLGGFELPLSPGERPRLVRAMNVLRGYPEAQVPVAHASMAAPLLPGGLLVEGSTCTEGHVLVAHLMRRGADRIEDRGLLFATDFARGFAPMLFRDRLPRDLRRRVRPGEPIHDFLTAWQRAFDAVRAGGVRAPAETFTASVERLRCTAWPVEVGATLPGAGAVVWRVGGSDPDSDSVTHSVPDLDSG
ncbi:MAG: methylase [Myxococcales bacterium]